MELAPLAQRGVIEIEPHQGWLTSPAQFDQSHPKGGPWRMDRFYRHVRQATGILMDSGKPVGGKFSFDAANRKAWRGDPAAPDVPTFDADEVTEEVCQLVNSQFADHPGRVDPAALPTTASDADALWRWAMRACMPNFGPFQDAMSAQHASLFHGRISALLHLQRLLPRDVVADVLAADLPIASKEGFIRQVLGWREFVRHVHERTDGLRDLPAADDCGQQFLDSRNPLPAAYWGKPSGLHCLDRVVADVWREGYGHHITRLMVLANIATLLDVSPRELTDWFWVAYTDAYDWVVEPNVLGMGTFAVGAAMTTKPYIAGSAYIDRMSDYCRGCQFDPRRDCPIRSLYWAFLDRHQQRLRDVARLSVPLASLSKRGAEQRANDRRVFERVHDALAAGRVVPAGADA